MLITLDNNLNNLVHHALALIAIATECIIYSHRPGYQETDTNLTWPQPVNVFHKDFLPLHIASATNSNLSVLLYTAYPAPTTPLSPTSSLETPPYVNRTMLSFIIECRQVRYLLVQA
jgi:hypothetical protein